jgi:prophage DNA circulation protein
MSLLKAISSTSKDVLGTITASTSVLSNAASTLDSHAEAMLAEAQSVTNIKKNYFKGNEFKSIVEAELRSEYADRINELQVKAKEFESRKESDTKPVEELFKF